MKKKKRVKPLTPAEIARISKATNFGYTSDEMGVGNCGQPDGDSPTGKLLEDDDPMEHGNYYEAIERIAAWLGLTRAEYKEMTTTQRKRAVLGKLGKLTSKMLLKEIQGAIANTWGELKAGDLKTLSKCSPDELTVVLKIFESLP